MVAAPVEALASLWASPGRERGIRWTGQSSTEWRVCRMHGAGGGHPAGPSHPRWVHGLRSREWTEMRKAVNELVREGREIEKMINTGQRLTGLDRLFPGDWFGDSLSW